MALSFWLWLRTNGFRNSKPCHSLCHSRVRIWSYIIDPFFCAKTESAANPLPLSVIVPSLSDFAANLPGWVQCPVRAIKFLRKAARSASYVPRNPERAMSKNAISFSLQQLITDGGAVSSSRPPGAHDVRGIATSLNYYSNLFPTLCKLLRGGRSVSSLIDTSKRTLPPRMISGNSALWALLGTGCIPGPHSIIIRLLSYYSPLASFEY